MDGFISDDEKSISYKKTVDLSGNQDIMFSQIKTDVFVTIDEYIYFELKAYRDPNDIRGQGKTQG